MARPHCFSHTNVLVRLNSLKGPLYVWVPFCKSRLPLTFPDDRLPQALVLREVMCGGGQQMRSWVTLFLQKSLPLAGKLQVCCPCGLDSLSDSSRDFVDTVFCKESSGRSHFLTQLLFKGLRWRDASISFTASYVCILLHVGTVL